MADSSHDALIALDRETRVTATSARAELVLGYSERSLLGRPFDGVVIESRRDDLSALVRAALEGADVFQHDSQTRRRDGSLVDLVIDLAPLREAPGGEIVGVSAILQDITERKQLERELRFQSIRDPLTGLYNRRHFELELRRAVRLAERHGNAGAVMLVDIDRFKVVNDSRGHPVGDEVLRDLASALAGSVRDSDVVARLGGDEFAVLLPNVDRAGAAATADKLLAAARSALEPWRSSVSVGASHFGPGATLDSKRVLASADQALYRVKAAGGNLLDLDGG